MATLTFYVKTYSSGEPSNIAATLKIDGEKLISVSTDSLYVRKGFKNGTLFLSQRHQGEWGAGDICKINEDYECEVHWALFNRLRIYATKANAILT